MPVGNGTRVAETSGRERMKFSGKSPLRSFPTTSGMAADPMGGRTPAFGRFLCTVADCSFTLEKILEDLQRDSWPVPVTPLPPSLPSSLPRSVSNPPPVSLLRGVALPSSSLLSISFLPPFSPPSSPLSLINARSAAPASPCPWRPGSWSPLSRARYLQESKERRKKGRKGREGRGKEPPPKAFPGTRRRTERIATPKLPPWKVVKLIPLLCLYIYICVCICIFLHHRRGPASCSLPAARQLWGPGR